MADMVIIRSSKVVYDYWDSIHYQDSFIATIVIAKFLLSLRPTKYPSIALSFSSLFEYISP